MQWSELHVCFYPSNYSADFCLHLRLCEATDTAEHTPTHMHTQCYGKYCDTVRRLFPSSSSQGLIMLTNAALKIFPNCFSPSVQTNLWLVCEIIWQTSPHIAMNVLVRTSTASVNEIPFPLSPSLPWHTVDAHQRVLRPANSRASAAFNYSDTLTVNVASVVSWWLHIPICEITYVCVVQPGSAWMCVC